MLNLLLLSTAFAQEPNACSSEKATAAYAKGFEAQRNRNTSSAIKAYKDCLVEEPNCMLCHYEIGWSYWSRSNWPMVEKHWTKVVELEQTLTRAQIQQFHRQAKRALLHDDVAGGVEACTKARLKLNDGFSFAAVAASRPRSLCA